MNLKQSWFFVATLACLVSACTAPQSTQRISESDIPADDSFRELKNRFAPDSHLAVYAVGWDSRAGGLRLTGDVDRAEAK
ncbi:hypothetical protein, partial [Salmonella enterica]|uniref:hypothetical protein n=1 Tax=Salmonella enterica TaxID=28901 RepID=UPI0039EB1E9D